MSRFRLAPTREQAARLLEQCRHARFMWNLALEQWSMWRHDKTARPPRYVEQARQLTDARSDNEWLRAGSQTVQQQALRDFDQALKNFFGGSHGRPTWRKQGVHEGFRIVGPQAGRTERLNRKWARILIPKVGWVRVRLSRALPAAKSYRVTCDRVGRWHIAFAAIPAPIPAPGTGEIVGVDRGVAVSAALSTGELLKCPGLTKSERKRLLRLQRKLARARRGSNRRAKTRTEIAKLKAHEAHRRKDWVEKTSTGIARRFDIIRVEDLRIRNMTSSAKGTVENPGRRVAQKAGLNREILRNGWGLLVTRLEQKASGRVERVLAARTSQTCSLCGHCASDNRESQAVFRCRACGYRANADVNAAINIAAGRAVTARRADAVQSAPKREPQPTTST